MNRPKYKELFNNEHNKKIIYLSYIKCLIQIIKNNNLVDKISIEKHQKSFDDMLEIKHNDTYLCMRLDEDLKNELKNVFIRGEDNE